MYIRKTFDEYSIEGLYDGVFSTECICENFRDAKEQLKTYIENCPFTVFRIKKSRVRIQNIK